MLNMQPELPSLIFMNWKSTVASARMSAKYVMFFLFVFVVVATAKRDRIRERMRSDDRESLDDRDRKLQDALTTTTGHSMVGDAVVEKFVETLMASERYLKMIETVERKLNHLDATFHEKSNSILKYATETLRMVKASPSDLMEKALGEMKVDLDRLKQSVTTRLDHPTMRVESSGYHGDGSLESRLMSLEGLVRGVMNGVESIVATMAEVKGRQAARTYTFKGDAATPTSSSESSSAMAMINEFRKILHDQRGKKCECRSGRVDRAERYPTDCHEIQIQGFNVSGIYKIKPDEMEPFYILCDLTTAGGGWTVFQNRYDGSQDFFKGWTDYKYGFGNLAGEFWLGLDKINYLTNQKLYELRVEVETQHGQEAYAGYSVFTVGPEHEGFRISTLGTYYGTAGDSLSYHAGQKFSTLDSDNDEWKDGSCATEHGGAWWYKECDKRTAMYREYECFQCIVEYWENLYTCSNLNGKYASTAEENRGQSIYWISFKGPNYPLTKTKMMIRPLPASKPLDFNDNRKLIDIAKPRPVHEKQKNIRPKDVKSTYDLSHRHSATQFRYDDARADAFMPYA